ncbi:MAG: MFS transporter [Pseudomonadota bacterium]
MQAILLPLLIVMLPQICLSALQLGVPVLAPAFVVEVGMAPEAVGLIGGCIGFGSVWMFAANPEITPVLGPLPALMIACLLSVIGSGLVLTGMPAAILIGAVVIGFAYAVTAPAGSQILSTHVPRHWWGTVFSIRQAGVPLGGAIAGILGTSLASAFGWRLALGVLTAFPLICAGVLFAAPRRFHAGANGQRFRVSGLFKPSNVAVPFRTLRADPQLRAMTLASLGFAAVQGSLFAFFTTYLTDGLGFDLVMAGALFATLQIVSFMGRLGAGALADRMGAFRPLLRAMSVMAALFCAVLALIHTGWPDWALYLIAGATGLAAATWNGLYLAEIARLVTPDRVGQATAGATFFTFVAYMATPPLFGLIVLLSGYELAFLTAGCAVLASFWLLRKA